MQNKRDGIALIAATSSHYNPETQKRITSALLAHGANPNTQGLGRSTVLMGAARAGNKVAAKLLVEHGADVSIKNSQGKTAVDMAKGNL